MKISSTFNIKTIFITIVLYRVSLEFISTYILNNWNYVHRTSLPEGFDIALYDTKVLVIASVYTIIWSFVYTVFPVIKTKKGGVSLSFFLSIVVFIVLILFEVGLFIFAINSIHEPLSFRHYSLFYPILLAMCFGLMCRKEILEK